MIYSLGFKSVVIKWSKQIYLISIIYFVTFDITIFLDKCLKKLSKVGFQTKKYMHDWKI